MDTTIHNKLLYELQTLCNIYRAEVRNFFKTVKIGLKKRPLDPIYEERIISMIKNVSKFHESFRELHLKFLNYNLHLDLRTALNWADESISIITSRWFISLYDICEGVISKLDIMEMIKVVIDSEEVYRKSMNYKYQYDKNNKLCGETMAYRESVLKKWYQSAMYMNNENSRAPKQVGHIIAGIAAGIAMTFTVLVIMFAENYFPKNSTLLILAMVISYIFKDRIKEVLRKTFGNMLPGLTTDQQTNLYDPALKSKVGRSSGSIRFCTPLDIPEAIYNIRYRKLNPFRTILPANNIIHYKRRISIKSELLKGNHTRLEAVTEIIRFQLDDWLKDMDDSKADLWTLDNGKKIKISGERVYRVFLIISLNREKYYNYILTVNKSGIVRIKRESV